MNLCLCTLHSSLVDYRGLAEEIYLVSLPSTLLLLLLFPTFLRNPLAPGEYVALLTASPSSSVFGMPPAPGLAAYVRNAPSVTKRLHTCPRVDA